MRKQGWWFGVCGSMSEDHPPAHKRPTTCAANRHRPGNGFARSGHPSVAGAGMPEARASAKSTFPPPPVDKQCGQVSPENPNHKDPDVPHGTVTQSLC